MKKSISVGFVAIVLLAAIFSLTSRVTASDVVEPDFSTVTTAPYPLLPYSGNPVLTASMVTDRQACFVADPFMFHENNVWYMFFEVYSSTTDQDIGLATSNDGFHWTYQRIVLDTAGHAAYPYVFKCNGNYYMVPDPCLNIITVYKATDFPYSWTSVATVSSSSVWFADPSLVYLNGMWWMFVSDTDSSNCYLYYASSVTGPWTTHLQSPVIRGNAGEARGGGRIVVFGDKALRLVQKCDARFGEKVTAYQIDTLTTVGFAEHEIPDSPLLVPSGSGWNANAMHNLDPWWTGNNWIACADGYSDSTGVYSIGMYTTTSTPQSPPPSPPNGQVVVLGNSNVGTSENNWGGEVDLCKFQWNNSTGTCAGNITVYLSHIDPAPNNRMVVGIYDSSLNKIAASPEKTGLIVGWNTQSLTGTFTLTNGAWYWLVVHAPSTSYQNGRMASGSVTGQHGWASRSYDGTLPSTLTVSGTQQMVCSIYASITTANNSSPASTHSLTVNTQPIVGLTTIISNSSFTWEIASGTTANLQTGTYTVAVPTSLTMHYTGNPDETWLFNAWSDGVTTNTRQITLNKNTVLSATYVLQKGST